jgi:hypothetical protein
MKVATKKTLLVTCLLSGCLVLTSCRSSGTDSSSGNDFLTWGQANQEYQNTVNSFPYSLPSGIAFPVDVSQSPDAGQYQRGWAEMQAYIFAECAYQTIVVANETTDMTAALSALDDAQRIHNSPGFQAHFDDPDGVWNSIVDKARLGDFATFNQFFQSDCDK